MKSSLRRLAAAALLSLTLAPVVQAQQLVAWPLHQTGLWRHLFPGQPMPRPLPRPLPPRPQPMPRPQPHDPPPRDGRAPLELADYSIEGRVDGRAAELTYSMVFRNPGNGRLEGLLLMPLPEGAVVEKFSMTVAGKEQKAELLDAAQARSIYEAIVRQARDPGLLELAGERGLRARVFPIEPRGEIAVRITLTHLLRRDAGLASLTVPIRAAQTTHAGGGRVRARLTLAADAPLRTVFSPNSSARVERRGEREAVVTLEAANPAEAGDLALVFSTGADPLAPSLVTFREEGEDGYFMLNLAPRADGETAAKAAPKDVVFIVDRSGSMEEGGKMDQARRALLYCLERLGPEDRFGIVDFATDAQEFAPSLVAATAEQKARARRYVQRIEAAGGTNIEAGLAQGLKVLGEASGARPAMAFFLTDGLPTAGRTDIGELLKLAADRGARRRVRLFAFGVGSDVNTLLLDKLADGNGGSRDYVAPGEDIEAKVSTLYQKVAKPALTDVSIEWQGVEPTAVYPRPIRDLFWGSELALVGRYEGSGRGKLIVRGTMAGKPRVFEYPLEWRARSEGARYLPRVWASRKIAHELDAIRLSGRADPEIVADIVKLAKRHGIVTPYTSYLIVEEGMSTAAANRMAMESAADIANTARASGFTRGLSGRAQKMSRMFAAAAAPAASVGGAGGASVFDEGKLESEAREELRVKGVATVDTRSLAGKTFYKRGGVWVDGEAELDSTAKRETVEYLSERWFELARDAKTARWLSLGERVTLARGGVIYEIAP